MNYTENYHLPQWEETDRVMMIDFNQMCADMEAGLSGNAQAAANALSVANSKPTSAAVSQVQAAANQAQTTADSALSKANAAQTTANKAYSPSKKPHAVGTYTGTGAQERSISVGFRPSLVLIRRIDLDSLDELGIGVDGLTTYPVRITDTGFSFVYIQGALHSLNSGSIPYAYIAFR